MTHMPAKFGQYSGHDSVVEILLLVAFASIVSVCVCGGGGGVGGVLVLFL